MLYAKLQARGLSLTPRKGSYAGFEEQLSRSLRSHCNDDGDIGAKSAENGD